MDKELLADKIRKLLALSKSPNKNEAEAALAKVNELLAKYQIAMCDVLVEEAKQDGVHKGKVVSVSETYRSFVCTIAAAAGKMFDVKDIGTGEQSTFYYIGQPEDIKHAEILFHHLFETWKSIVSRDTAAWKNTFYREPAQYAVKKYKIGHGQGFADAIWVRVCELVRQRQEELKKTATGTQLVVLKDQLIRTWVAENTVSSRAHKPQFSGYAEGRAAGYKIPITTGLDNKKKLTGDH